MGARIVNIIGTPGTVSAIFLRFIQAVFATAALYCISSTTSIFNATWNTHSFCFLLVAAALQIVWSFSLMILDIYALRMGRNLQSQRIVLVFALGDGVISTLLLAATSASFGVTIVHINGSCVTEHCTQFQFATFMAFLSWTMSLPSFFVNYVQHLRRLESL